MRTIAALVTLIASGGLLSVSQAAPNSTEILQFEGVAPPGMSSPFITHDYVTEGSYRLMLFNAQYASGTHPGMGTVFPSNDTDWLLNKQTAGILIRHKELKPFTIHSFDATEFTRGLPSGTTIQVDGISSERFLDIAIFQTSPRSIGTTPFFQHFELPLLWNKLPFRAVQIYNKRFDQVGFAIDNIVLTTVPEPSAWLVGVTTGIILCIGWKRLYS